MMSHYSWGMSQSVVEDKIAHVMDHILENWENFSSPLCFFHMCQILAVYDSIMDPIISYTYLALFH